MHVKCKISRGGFSSERVCTVQLDGRTHTCCSPLHYVWTSPDKPIKPDQPASGESIDGYVECRLCDLDEDRAVIDFPPGDRVVISPDEYKSLQEEAV